MRTNLDAYHIDQYNNNIMVVVQNNKFIVLPYFDRIDHINYFNLTVTNPQVITPSTTSVNGDLDDDHRHISHPSQQSNFDMLSATIQFCR